MSQQNTVIVGAGPAGLTAAYELSKFGRTATVIEADDIVGGISRTCEYKGYRFDIGGHRFFTKVEYVQDLWQEILEEDFLKRPRLSRIYYRSKFFDYPLKPVNALLGLGPVEAVRIGFSYLKAQLLPIRNEVSFEHWITNRFGKRLFQIFFKGYTEKVWGMGCDEISADWAAQRIKNLDLLKTVQNALFGSLGKSKGEVITTLIEEFHYPRHGPGQMWEDCTKELEKRGTKVSMKTKVIGIRHENMRVLSMRVRDENGAEHEIEGDQFLSTMPIRSLIRSMDPPPPPEVLEAADRLRYRDFLTVAIIVDQPDLFPDNWIYIHEDDVKVGRIQNFKNWSPEMVADPSRTALGLEYFVQENDDVWSMADADLVELARKEIDFLGLANAADVVDGTVVRMPKAYPVYDGVYQEALEVIRGWLDQIDNLQLIGRNGQHRYNNQDHSMVTAVYAARNIVGENYDVWDVNVEEDYHEEGAADPNDRLKGSASTSGDRMVPQRVERPRFEESLAQVFARYDAKALGLSVGLVSGLLLFAATAILLIKGGDPIGPNLSLLGHFLVGYEVSWAGAIIGLVEGIAGGFVFGYGLASVINWIVRRELRQLFARAEGTRGMSLFEGDEL